MNQSAFAGALCGRPACVESVCGCHSEQADVPSILGHQPNGSNRLGRNRASISDDDLTIRSWLTQPVGAIDNVLPELVGHLTFDLLDRPRGEPQIDRTAGFVAQPVALIRFTAGLL